MKRFVSIMVLLIFVFMIAWGYTNAHSVDLNSNALYVSPQGDDAASGTVTKPLKTIQKAKEIIRQMNINMSQDITVYLREGNYSLTESLIFDNSDSGTNGKNIIYKAYENEHPVVSSGVALTNWELCDKENNIYKTTIGDTDTRQLYVNGELADRSKSTSSYLKNVYITEEGFETSSIEIANWKNIKDIEFVFRKLWTQPRCMIESIHVEGEKAYIKMNRDIWHELRNRWFGIVINEAPIWIENAYELLDHEGEWYLDKAEKSLYYIPGKDADINELEIIIPTVEKMIVVEGTSEDNPVKNIQFNGISFQYAAWLGPNQAGGHPDAQANITGGVSPGTFIMRNAASISVENCTFSDLGNAAIDIMPGSRDILVQGNEIYDTCGNGIQIGEISEAYGKTQNQLEIIRDVTLSNNYIHDIGLQYPSAVAVFATWAQNLLITHNEIAHTPYGGINIGWGWGLIAPNNADNIVISHNRIYDILKVLPDNGGIYTLGPLKDCRIEGNYISRVLQYQAGIYLDNGTAYVNVNDNVVQDCMVRPFYVQTNNSSEESMPNNNLIENNYYSDCLMPQESDGAVTGITLTNDTNIMRNNMDLTGLTVFPDNVNKIIDDSGLQAEYKYLLEKQQNAAG